MEIILLIGSQVRVDRFAGLDNQGEWDDCWGSAFYLYGRPV
jgi:hypothetical protein